MQDADALHCPLCLLLYPQSVTRCPACGGLGLVGGEPGREEPGGPEPEFEDPVAIAEVSDPVDGQFIGEALAQEGIASRIEVVDGGDVAETFRLLVEARDAETAREILREVAPGGAPGPREDAVAPGGPGVRRRPRLVRAGGTIWEHPHARWLRLLDRARMLIAYGAFRGARAVLDEIEAEEGEIPALLAVRARLLAAEGDARGARALYARVLERFPFAYEAIDGLAALLEATGDEEDRRRALVLRHGLYRAVRRDVRLGWRVVDGARAIGDEDRALDALLLLAGVNPFFRDAVEELLDAWIAASRPIPTLLEAIEPDPPTFASPLAVLARALRDRGRFGEAGRAIQRGLALEPRSAALRRERALWHLAQAGRGRHAREAVAVLRALFEEDPRDVEVALDLLRALVAARERAEAERLGDRIAALAPDGDRGAEVGREIDAILDRFGRA